MLHWSLRWRFVLWWSQDQHVIISSLLTSAVSGVIGPEGAHKCIFGLMCFKYKGYVLILHQHNRFPTVIVKWDGFQCDSVSCCSVVTLVWRCFSMQIHRYSTICVNFILYGKNILNFVPNICKIEESSILRLYVNCYILCIPE